MFNMIRKIYTWGKYIVALITLLGLVRLYLKYKKKNKEIAKLENRIIQLVDSNKRLMSVNNENIKTTLLLIHQNTKVAAVNRTISDNIDTGDDSVVEARYRFSEAMSKRIEDCEKGDC